MSNLDTPNKEPKNLDEAIQLFKGYIREENGFDELDFKSYVQFRIEPQPSVENHLKEDLKVVGGEDELQEQLDQLLCLSCRKIGFGEQIMQLIKFREQHIVSEAREEGYDVNRMGSWVFIGDNKVLQNLDDLYWSYVMEQIANDSAEYDKYTLEYCKMNMEYAGFDKVGIHKMLARADQRAKERLATLKQSQKEE